MKPSVTRKRGNSVKIAALMIQEFARSKENEKLIVSCLRLSLSYGAVSSVVFKALCCVMVSKDYMYV